MRTRYLSLAGCIATVILAGHVIVPVSAHGQDSEPINLAAEARDPTASLTALTIRLDLTSSFHNLPDADQGTLVVQPVIPWKLGGKPHVARVTGSYVVNAPDWGNLAESAAVGNLPPNYTPTKELTGLGDLAAVDFFLYEAPWSGRWGIGPALLIPTASDPALSGGKWAAGPAAVAIYRKGELQLGVLGQGMFSFAGASDRDDLNMISMQPFGGLGFGGGWSVGLSEVQYNYNLDAKRWAGAAFGLRVEKLVHFGKQPARLFVDAEYQFIDDIVAAEWTYRFAVVPLL